MKFLSGAVGEPTAILGPSSIPAAWLRTSSQLDRMVATGSTSLHVEDPRERALPDGVHDAQNSADAQQMLRSGTESLDTRIGQMARATGATSFVHSFARGQMAARPTQTSRMASLLHNVATPPARRFAAIGSEPGSQGQESTREGT